MHENKFTGIKGWKEDDRPREKCLTHGIGALSDAELLAVMLGSGTKSRSAVELGRDILSSAKNRFSDLGRMGYKDLCRINGVGPAKAVTILAALEIGRRRRLEDQTSDKQVVSSHIAAEIFIPMLSDLPHEEFWVMLLNHANRCITKVRVSSGGVHQTVVDPKIIFKEALQHLASGIVLCHNHPSGSLTPSKQDIELTHQVIKGAHSLAIRVLDHIIVGGEGYFSFSDSNMLY